MGRIFALDYGEKRIGIAASDETKMIAQPRPFVLVSKKNELVDLIKSEKAELILLGLPKNLKGEEEKSARQARWFGKWLEKETNLPIKYIDERFTTKQASGRARAKGLKGKAARQELDSLSAQILLESYLRRIKEDK